MQDKKRRFVELDALRGLAAAGVVLLHLSTDFHHIFLPKQISLVTFPMGAYGVHLFFLISGFVILMTAEKSRSAREFALSRFFRLYPAYWVAVGLTALTFFLLPVPGGVGKSHIVMRGIANITMIETWFGVGTLDSVYWTLQVEMSFYIVIFVLIWFNAIDKALAVLTTIVCWSLIDHLFFPRDAGPAYTLFRQLFFVDLAFLFTLGVLIYKLRQEKFNLRHLAIIVACALSPATANYFPHNPLADTLISLALAAILYLAAAGRLEVLACRPLLFLGGISYSLYLVHHSFGQALLYYADRHGVDANAAFVLVVLLCVGLAYLMRTYVELPSLRWRQRRNENRGP